MTPIGIKSYLLGTLSDNFVEILSLNNFKERFMGHPLYILFLGDQGDFSCSRGNAEIHSVWFGFSSTAQMPRCGEKFDNNGNICVKSVGARMIDCAGNGVSHLFHSLL